MAMTWRAALAALPLLALSSAPALGEEGMWTFDNFPSARMRAEFGWAPDQAWLDRVMAGTARMPGCSASNVSGRGLVLTNHHCVIACVTALSSSAENFVELGFTAHTRAEERRCPNMSVQVLTGIEVVTERINAATAGAAADGFARARDAEIARIERACAQGSERCEVVTLYQGGRYAVYNFRRYDDVRLVFAPEHDMAAFGGDPDNFNFPRYCVDFAFLRLYDDGAPAATPNHLRMRFTPLEPGEVVLAAGNPGRTSRLRSSAELAFERDVALPWQIALLAEYRDRLLAYAAQGPDQARVVSSALQSVENSFKGLSGRRQALADAEGFARIVAREQDLQARVRRNRANQREVGDAWGEIARAQTAYRGMFYQYQYLEARAGERSLLFGWARDIVRGAEERALPDSERMPRYTEARLSIVERALGANQTIVPEFEALHLAFWLSELRQRLTPNNATTRRILGAESPETLAARLSRSRLTDPAYRMQLWEGGAEAVAASDDPLIQFVRAWDADARAVRTRYVTQVEGPIARAQERIARARFRAFGTDAYPDATFSPRITYGRVEGWSERDGRVVEPFTRVSGLYERATGAEPFALTPRWLDARERLDGDVIFNMSSSNDVIGGSSGSPLLDREGRVVGAVFDGNIHSLGGEYYYDGALNRSITVASTVIEAALDDVYGADALLRELRRD
jgi:hypothetical protein